MSVPVTQGSEARLLQEGINAVATIEYSDYPMEYSQIFTLQSSEKAYELDVSLSGTGLAALKPEGTSVVYDGEKQDFATTYTHAVFALGTIITMEAQMNNLKRDLIQKAGVILKRSLVHTYEQLQKLLYRIAIPAPLLSFSGEDPRISCRYLKVIGQRLAAL